MNYAILPPWSVQTFWGSDSTIYQTSWQISSAFFVYFWDAYPGHFPEKNNPWLGEFEMPSGYGAQLLLAFLLMLVEASPHIRRDGPFTRRHHRGATNGGIDWLPLSTFVFPLGKHTNACASEKNIGASGRLKVWGEHFHKDPRWTLSLFVGTLDVFYFRAVFCWHKIP